MSFASVEGQAAAAALLEQALSKDRLAHTLLFLGPQDSGQRKMAKELAKALFCVEKKGVPGCGECASCRQVEAGNHPDLRIFEPEEDAKALKVERIREMIAAANLRPFQASSKVFVMDRAEALSEVSQNALLKTLEEPPAHTYFVLICYAGEMMLPTIRSRSQTIHFRALPGSEKAPDKLERMKSAVWDRVSRGRSANTPDLSALTREEVREALEHSIRELREALMIRAGSEELLGEVNDRLQKEKMARAMTEDMLIERLETLAEFKEKIGNSVNMKLALSVLWEEL